MNRYQDDLRSIDVLLDEIDPYLAEALKAVDFPEIYGLLDPNRQDRAFKKLRGEIERVEHCLRRARDLSDLAWLDDDDPDPEPPTSVEAGAG